MMFMMSWVCGLATLSGLLSEDGRSQSINSVPCCACESRFTPEKGGPYNPFLVDCSDQIYRKETKVAK